MRNLKDRLVAIVGPTAVGKSRLAFHLAQTFGGEIVSADSRQVYCHMNIATAKPSLKELSIAPHHLISVINPDESFSLAQYQEMASRAIDDIRQRNELALLVGGSGLYVWSILEDWEIPHVPPDPGFRNALEEEAARDGTDELYRRLMEVDPAAGQRIDPHNTRRMIRALEVHRNTKTPSSQRQHKKPPPSKILIIGLTADRAELYRRIDARVDEMIEQGLVEEVKMLVNMGYSPNLAAMSGIGYKQIILAFSGELTLPAAIQQIKYETHRFVRHQYNWFRLQDDRIHWFNVQEQPGLEITKLVAKFIRGG